MISASHQCTVRLTVGPVEGVGDEPDPPEDADEGEGVDEKLRPLGGLHTGDRQHRLQEGRVQVREEDLWG